MFEGLLGSAQAVPLHLATGTSAVGVLAALWYRRYRVARILAAAQVSFIFWGWALAQYPYLLPPDFTISNTAAPPVTLRLVAGVLAVGALVLLPSLLYLFRVFKSAPADRPADP
jgi:cytochrome d ubiquinol oxidase subunit II